MPLSADEIHRRTDAAYRSISDDFNPQLKSFVFAGKAYERALQGVSATSKQYFDAMNKLGIIACDSASTKELGESIRHMSETLRQIQLHFDETVKFMSQEIIYPLENKLEHDQKYVLGAHKKYQNDYKQRGEDLDRATSNHKKMKRKSYNGKKPYKYDEKERQLGESVVLKQRALDQFQYENLKQAFIEERRRYCFFVEQQCDLTKKRIVFHQKSIESLSAHLHKWSVSCEEVQSLPENAAALLQQAKSDDTNSVYSIPEPPNEPAMQVNGYDYIAPSVKSFSTPVMERRDPDYDSRPATSNGHNVIPRENRKRVTAVYSHNVPGNPNQLTFEKDDIIILMIPQPRDGWHYGENEKTKQKGWFPYSYTKLLEQYNSPDKPKEPIHGHMPLPPADYNSTQPVQNGNGNAIHAPPQENGNPFANVQLRKTDYGDPQTANSFSSFR